MNKTAITLSPGSTVHLIGICGTGMGALAGLLVDAGYRVSGSDAGIYPPMSTQLEQRGIEISVGYGAHNLAHRPDLVVVGNICRPEHPEAVAAAEMGLRIASMPAVVRDLLLKGKRPIVIAGTHGKTTTTSLTATLLDAAGLHPSVLVGGVAANFGTGARLDNGPHFVIEGDEYDSAFFEKQAKFLSYEPDALVVTSVEHDHIDIYPTFEAYQDAFAQLVRLVRSGPIAVWAGSDAACGLMKGAAVEVVPYAAASDHCAVPPRLLARPTSNQAFRLIMDGADLGLFQTPLRGVHNLRNTLAALAMAHLYAKVDIAALARCLPLFRGVARRQELVATVRGVHVYDDFAHHPTAVRETLLALRGAHPTSKLIAAFEPRSATACRKLHQDAYAEAFEAADHAILAPVGRDLPEDSRLDTTSLAAAIANRGTEAVAAKTLEEVIERIAERVGPGDVVVLLSNGAFGDLRRRVPEALS
ncbi:MAG: Mur ligase family protein [Myxococcota bacterium]|jgi:UDP-N-acetylmuramate: L-alanyl-gamma-D-glutamyl-meso-diaminopimelate ligase|nr:Mur ligase family protein [Myxococcota bacterium]